MDVSKLLNPNLLKAGDVVTLTGADWSDTQKGLTRTIVGPYPKGYPGVELDPKTNSTQRAFIGHSDFSVTLVERDGKKVDAIAQHESRIRLLIQFEDGTVVGEDGTVYHAEANQPRNRAQDIGWNLVYDSNSPKFTTVDIEAVQRFATSHGLCEEFDQVMFHEFGWASRDVRIPTVNELRAVAERYDHLTTFLTLFPEQKKDNPCPDVGRWIRAKMLDGSTVEFEVVRTEAAVSPGATRVSRYTPTGKNYIHYKDYEAITPATKATRDCAFEEWEYIEKPWKVGDIVPAGTTVGRVWLGERTDGKNGAKHLALDSRDRSGHERVILWIDDKKEA